jgi:F-type H+-transporting ATPase subunit b
MDLMPNATILPMWVIFMVAAVMLNALIFKPTLKIIKQRQKLTVGMDKDVNYFQNQTQIKLEEYEALMQEAKKLARTAREDILKTAESEQKEIVGQARKEADGHLAGIRTTIQQESEQAKATLVQGADVLADSIVDKLVKKVA